jgi:hypothetical protein
MLLVVAAAPPLLVLVLLLVLVVAVTSLLLLDCSCKGLAPLSPTVELSNTVGCTITIPKRGEAANWG